MLFVGCGGGGVRRSGWALGTAGPHGATWRLEQQTSPPRLGTPGSAVRAQNVLGAPDSGSGLCWRGGAVSVEGWVRGGWPRSGVGRGWGSHTHRGARFSGGRRLWGLFLRHSPPLLRKVAPACQTRAWSGGPGALVCLALGCQAAEARWGTSRGCGAPRGAAGPRRGRASPPTPALPG